VHRYRVDVRELSRLDDPATADVAAYLADHRVQGAVLELSVGPGDGRLLGLGKVERTMTTCLAPRLYCRSSTVLSDFGIAVERPAVPKDDEVYWMTVRSAVHRSED
jgi:hypothetical protein